MLLIHACIASAKAHPSVGWILPSTSFFRGPDVVSFDAAISRVPFFADGFSMNIEYLLITAPDGKRVSADNVSRMRKRTVFDLFLQKNGTYRVSATAKDISAAWKGKDGRDQAVQGAADDVLSSLPADVGTVVVTEFIRRYETFVVIGKPSDVTVTGSGLELRFLESDASMLRVRKGEARFMLLLDGKPAPRIRGTVIRGYTQVKGRADMREFITNTEGQFLVEWTGAGFYLLEVSAIDKKTTVPQARERSLLYTATLEVLPAN